MTNIISGADSSWYKGYFKHEATRKYHKYFRQRDTLLNIPKVLEDKVEKEDSKAFEDAKSTAKENRSKITFDEIVKTIPESAAIVKDDSETSKETEE